MKLLVQADGWHDMESQLRYLTRFRDLLECRWDLQPQPAMASNSGCQRPALASATGVPKMTCSRSVPGIDPVTSVT